MIQKRSTFESFCLLCLKCYSPILVLFLIFYFLNDIDNIYGQLGRKNITDIEAANVGINHLTTIRISRKTLNQLGKLAKFRDNWDTAIQQVLKKADERKAEAMKKYEEKWLKDQGVNPFAHILGETLHPRTIKVRETYVGSQQITYV